MEKLTCVRKLLLDAAYDYRVNTVVGEGHVVLTHPDTFKELVDETMSGEAGVTTILHGAVIDVNKISKLTIVGIKVRRCPDVEVGTFEIF